MTAQMPEKLFYQGTEYALIMWEEGQLFTLESCGMHPAMIHTACWRGYFVTYDLGEEGLIVREFSVRLTGSPSGSSFVPAAQQVAPYVPNQMIMLPKADHSFK